MKKQITLILAMLICGVISVTAQTQFTNQIQGTPQGLTDQDNPSRTVVHTTDSEIQGSLGIGNDIPANYTYGFDTFVLAENNLRIYFNDTSNSGSFPGNDWRITANDSNNGGDNYFSIDDASAGRAIFRLDAGAPTNSLRVDSNGDVGIGTDNPVVEVHLRDGDSPTMRLEQDGSAGFGAQTWDIAGNETNFFVRDVTNGSALPFKIQPGADNNTLNIGSTGNVGIGAGGLNSINDNASLELGANDKGLQLNRLTTIQRDALGLLLAGTEVGVLVFDTDLGELLTWDGTSWNGGLTDTDNQIADVFQLNGDNLELSLEDDGAATQQVDLSGYLDNTDDQTADVFQLNGNNLELSLEDDGAATQQVDLSGYLDNTDDQTADVFQLNGNNLELSLEDDGAATQQVDLSGYLDNTDDQTADVFQLNGNNLELSLEDDGAATQQVDLSGYLDNTDNQNIAGSGLAGTDLTIGISGGTSQTVDLSSLDDSGTDDQQLSLAGNSLDLEDGGSVDLSGYLDNTDNQNIAGSGLAGTDLTIGISGGTSQTVDLSSLSNSGTDDQQLSLAGNSLDLEDGGSVDLSGYLDNTDNQNISGSGLTGSNLTIGISGGTSQTVDLSYLNNAGTDDQILANFLLTNQLLSLTIENGNGVQVNLAPLIQPLEDENAAQQAQIDALLANAAAQQAQIDDLIARVEALEDCACTTLDAPDFDPNSPGRAYLYQNVPNPFGNTTSIGYFIPFKHSNANLIISSTTGQILSNISIQKFGDGTIEFNKAALQSAMYFYTLYVDGKKVDTKRMLVE